MTASMLPELPDVVTNRILQRYLTPDDLRSSHQVSTRWRDMIESRALVNQKRIACVEAIRNDKENVLPHPKGNRSRPSSRSSSNDSLQTLNLRTYRLRSCTKPFKEIHENNICDDNNNSTSSILSNSTSSSPSMITRSMSRKSQDNNKTPPSSPGSNSSTPNTSPSKLSAKTKALLNGLGNVKRKGKASLRRIANM